MADEERFLEDEAAQPGEDVEVGKKVGFLPAIVLKILKWGAIGMVVLLLVFVVGYMAAQIAFQGRVPSMGFGTSTEPPVHENPRGYFRNIEQIRGQTSDNPPQLFMAKINIGYEKGNNAIQTELNERQLEIHNIAFLFLGGKLASELQNKYILSLQNQLKNLINQVMSSGLIKEVLIEELQVFPM